MELTISQLAEKLGADLNGEGTRKVRGVNSVDFAEKDEVTFIRDEKFLPHLEKSKAAAVIVKNRIDNLGMPQLIVEEVNVGLITALNLFAPKLKRFSEGIDPTAKIGQDVTVGKGVHIGPGAVIGDNVEIGKDTILYSGTKIGQNSKIGENCRIHSNVVIYHNCQIGNNVIIQANSTIGSTGFGYALIDGKNTLVPHNGGVIIEDCVEIGANCCVDRAKFNNTVIGAGTKIDNLVQIAHNVTIGKCCLIAGQVGVGGSATIGDRVIFGGQSGAADNIEIGDGTMLAAQTGALKSITEGKKVMGTPATDIKTELKAAALRGRLPQLFKQFRDLVSRIEKLESSEDNKK